MNEQTSKKLFDLIKKTRHTTKTNTHITQEADDNHKQEIIGTAEALQTNKNHLK